MKTHVQVFVAALTAVAAAGVAVVALFAPPGLLAQPPTGATPALSQTNSAATTQTNSVATTQTNGVPPKADPPQSKKITVRHQLTGAELYSMHCNRCHAERYPTERTAAQWKTIMLHMQVRANLPVSQARLILKYLQENSGR